MTCDEAIEIHKLDAIAAPPTFHPNVFLIINRGCSQGRRLVFCCLDSLDLRTIAHYPWRRLHVNTKCDSEMQKRQIDDSPENEYFLGR